MLNVAKGWRSSWFIRFIRAVEVERDSSAPTLLLPRRPLLQCQNQGLGEHHAGGARFELAFGRGGYRHEEAGSAGKGVIDPVRDSEYRKRFEGGTWISA